MPTAAIQSRTAWATNSGPLSERMKASKKRLAGDTARQATSPEVKGLRAEATALENAVADLTLENRLLEKSVLGDGDDDT